MKCPCENCICVPVCKHKKYHDLLECEILLNFIEDELVLNVKHVCDYFNAVHRRIIYATLKPSAWLIDVTGRVVNPDEIKEQKNNG